MKNGKGDSAKLIGRYNDGYFPPYVYTTSELRGEAGETYTLSIQTDDEYVTAETKIPTQKAIMDGVIPIKAIESDTLYKLTIYTHKQEERGWYNIFVLEWPDVKYYRSALMGTYCDNDCSINTIEIKRRKGYGEESNPFYKKGDSLIVKACSMDSMAYEYWKSYEKMILLSRNAFFVYDQDLLSNINGGIGYFFGYNSTKKRIIIE